MSTSKNAGAFYMGRSNVSQGVIGFLSGVVVRFVVRFRNKTLADVGLFDEVGEECPSAVKSFFCCKYDLVNAVVFSQPKP